MYQLRSCCWGDARYITGISYIPELRNLPPLTVRDYWLSVRHAECANAEPQGPRSGGVDAEYVDNCAGGAGHIEDVGHKTFKHVEAANEVRLDRNSIYEWSMSAISAPAASSVSRKVALLTRRSSRSPCSVLMMSETSTADESRVRSADIVVTSSSCNISAATHAPLPSCGVLAVQSVGTRPAAPAWKKGMAITFGTWLLRASRGLKEIRNTYLMSSSKPPSQKS